MPVNSTAKHITFYSILICFSVFLLSNAKGTNLKPWSPSDKLTWADYRDTTILKAHKAASTSSGIGVDYKSSEPKILDLKISCAMDRDKSWVDPARKNDYILSHEQYHFNISEYWCRKLRKEISTSHFSSKNFRDKIEDIRKDNWAKCTAMQQEYDLDTKHSVVKAEQKQWEAKIDQLLKSMEDYDSPAVTVDLK